MTNRYVKSNCREEFKTTEIMIGREGNKIYLHPDGDMMFRDKYVPGIKLKDLAGLSSEVVLDPAVIVFAEVSDWIQTTVDDQIIYTLTINHNFNVEPYQYFVELTKVDGTIITIDTLDKRQFSVVLFSTIATDLYISIKRIS